MPPPKTYNEKSKETARKFAINSAVDCLTKNRRTATLCRRSYVREVRDYLATSENGYDALEAKKLQNTTIDRWEAFYDSVSQSKEPKNLKVAYLCGPNPENDLRVLTAAGILPENIWAFETDTTTYGQAIAAALASEFPFVKIIHGGIDVFLEASPQKFDIIYLDFCGSLPSRNKKQKTLLAISRILARHALNSPGIIVTNVSLPTENGDSHGRSLLAKLVACYLYPKEFLECEATDSGFTEGAIAEGYSFDKWLEMVSENLDNYYGQFVTRLMMDHASFVSPYSRFPAQSSVYKKFFSNLGKADHQSALNSSFHFDDDSSGGDVIVDAGQYPILWAFAALDKALNAGDENYPQIVMQDEDFRLFADLFLSQLHNENRKDDLIRNISNLTFTLLASSHAIENLSPKLQNIVANHSFREYHQFCDLLLPHQIIELLFRQVAVPYHVNVEKTLRWKYQAKETPMYMDMIVLDECRYLYDWMPTTDMIANGFSNIERQLTFRFALDGVSKHRRWYNPEYFFGTAVVDQFTDLFEAKVLQPRCVIE
ncbi:hypothetical protein [Octadecabacter ascidiaceicola]|uniref:Methyltransferase domain-containing protein n=1 Tax=Octadecabacter ascidiaceicola TaxID=1655543 RepID=A0A238KAE5_9RHOB|nr:hypothetical protein [Octadecabacter ascidiaceicola]SMX39394.1 hypothetical protein OCA8868_01956 [Octadecabacter ascidiaceicola]